MERTEEIIARNIRALRKARDWSQERLADEATVNRPHMSDIETAKYSIGVDLLTRIATALGVQPHTLLDPATADIVAAANTKKN